MHSSLDATLGKVLPNCYRPTLVSDTERMISNCVECRKLRGHTLISPQLRSNQYDRPFYVIFLDYVGPIRPASRSGCRFLLAAVCAFSGWGWALPTVDSTSETTAKFLVERVFCDLAGFPVFLRHDRASAFLSDVTRDINRVFGMTSCC